MLTKRDKKKLIDKVNFLFEKGCIRVLVQRAPDGVLMFYENNAESINAEVVIIRSLIDESEANRLIKEDRKMLMVFCHKHYAARPFTDISQQVKLPKALLRNAEKNIKPGDV